MIAQVCVMTTHCGGFLTWSPSKFSSLASAHPKTNSWWQVGGKQERRNVTMSWDGAATLHSASKHAQSCSKLLNISWKLTVISLNEFCNLRCCKQFRLITFASKTENYQPKLHAMMPTTAHTRFSKSVHSANIPKRAVHHRHVPA